MKNLDYIKARTLDEVEWVADRQIKEINENEKKGKISDYTAGFREAMKFIKAVIRIREEYEEKTNNDK